MRGVRVVTRADNNAALRAALDHRILPNVSCLAMPFDQSDLSRFGLSEQLSDGG